RMSRQVRTPSATGCRPSAISSIRPTSSISMRHRVNGACDSRVESKQLGCVVMIRQREHEHDDDRGPDVPISSALASTWPRIARSFFQRLQCLGREDRRLRSIVDALVAEPFGPTLVVAFDQFANHLRCMCELVCEAYIKSQRVISPKENSVWPHNHRQMFMRLSFRATRFSASKISGDCENNSSAS